MITIYTLTSPLHDEASVEAVTREFLNSLGIGYVLKGNDYSDYGTSTLSLIYVRTGGTEGLFRQLLPQLLKQSRQPFYLLTLGKSNSLAASMEILSFLRQQGIEGEILHGSADYIRNRIAVVERVQEARRNLQGKRLGIVGKPSDWLISSTVDAEAVRRILGIELVEIPMSQLLDEFHSLTQLVVQSDVQKMDASIAPLNPSDASSIKQSLADATRLFYALKNIIQNAGLEGVTIRCFDLLTTIRNTGCIALARLNSEGYVAGCEGDVPAMLSMMIARSLMGVSGFQANPAHIDPSTGTILFAHCTIPLQMTRCYELDTHFESGIGVGIRGFVDAGPVTIFKVDGRLNRYFVAEGELHECRSDENLCRTQQLITLNDPSQAQYFLTRPIGNHHIVLPGHVADQLAAMLTGVASMAC